MRTRLLLPLLAAFAACATASRTATPATQGVGEGERILASASGSFSAVFPDKGWQVVERLPEAVKVEPGDRPLSLTVLADYLAPDEAEQPIGDLVKALISRQIADKAEWHIVEQGEAWLGGRPAVRVQATTMIGQNPLLAIVISCRDGARLYSVELTGVPAMVAVGLSSFDRIADTFRFTPRPGDEPKKNASVAELSAEAERSVRELDPSRAVALFARAVALEPTNGELAEKLVRAAMLTGDVARAMRVLKTDVSRNPDHFDHWRLLAMLQMQQGDPVASIATLKAAADRPGAPGEVLAALGEAYLHGGDMAAAERSLVTAAARAPKEAELQAALGDLYLREHKFDQAETALKAALAIDPSRGEYHAALSEVYGHRNQDRLAADECMDALERGVPKELEATLKYNLACFNARLGHQRECLYWLRQAFEAGFNDVDFMRKDPDLASVRDLPAFRELFEGGQPEE